MSDDPIGEAARMHMARMMDRMLFDAFTHGTGVGYTNAAGEPDEGLTLEKVLAAADMLAEPPKPDPFDPWARLQQNPLSFAPSLGGLTFVVKDAQEQMRTPRDVRGPWVRPGRVPSKRRGRKGTRRAWKRSHPPGYVWYFREPEDMLVLNGREAWVTPRQLSALRRAPLTQVSAI
jgi:hypothetical protein